MEKNGSLFINKGVVDLDYTALLTTLIDLLHVVQHVGEGHEGLLIFFCLVV